MWITVPSNTWPASGLSSFLNMFITKTFFVFCEVLVILSSNYYTLPHTKFNSQIEQGYQHNTWYSDSNTEKK